MGAYILQEDVSISKEERRKMVLWSDVSYYPIYNKEFGVKLEDYALDQIALRNPLRKLKTFVAYDVLQQKDNNGLYYQNEHWFKKPKAYDEAAINRFVSKMNEVTNTLSHTNAYAMVIPEKQFYTEKNDFLAIKEQLQRMNAKDMNIEKQLNVDSYYYGDPHVTQQAYLQMMPFLESSFQLEKRKDSYQMVTYPDFIGAYATQGSYKRAQEDLNYFHNDILDDANVFYYDNQQLHEVYNVQKLDDFDAYTVFLDGPSSFIKIENTKRAEGKTLVMVRDSFGSALAPLLVPYYKTIYMIDLRYTSLSNIQTFIEDPIDDLVFVYGEISVRESKNLK